MIQLRENSLRGYSIRDKHELRGMIRAEHCLAWKSEGDDGQPDYIALRAIHPSALWDREPEHKKQSAYVVWNSSIMPLKLNGWLSLIRNEHECNLGCIGGITCTASNAEWSPVFQVTQRLVFVALHHVRLKIEDLMEVRLQQSLVIRISSLNHIISSNGCGIETRMFSSSISFIPLIQDQGWGERCHDWGLTALVGKFCSHPRFSSPLRHMHCFWAVRFLASFLSAYCNIATQLTIHIKRSLPFDCVWRNTPLGLGTIITLDPWLTNWRLAWLVERYFFSGGNFSWWINFFMYQCWSLFFRFLHNDTHERESNGRSTITACRGESLSCFAFIPHMYVQVLYRTAVLSMVISAEFKHLLPKWCVDHAWVRHMQGSLGLIDSMLCLNLYSNKCRHEVRRRWLIYCRYRFSPSLLPCLTSEWAIPGSYISDPMCGIFMVIRP